MMPLLFGDFFNFVLEFLLFGASGFMILLVLVQRGRGGGLTGALGGMGGQSAFGAKAGDVFTRITVVSAIIWICLCLVTIMNYTYVPVDNSRTGEYNYETLLGGSTQPAPGNNPDDGPGATITGTDPEKEGTSAGKDGDEKTVEPKTVEPKTVEPKTVEPKNPGNDPQKKSAESNEGKNKATGKKTAPGEGQKPDAGTPKSGQPEGKSDAGKSDAQQKPDVKVESKK